jgi:hypothetical protein
VREMDDFPRGSLKEVFVLMLPASLVLSLNLDRMS